MYRDKGFQKGEENARRAYSTSVFKPLPADHQTSQNIKGGSHPLRNQSNGLALDGRQGFGELKTWCDSSRGPRSVGEQNHSVSPAKKDLPGHRVQRDNYNLPDFVTNYENAKFFVIKSFQEVDIHKSIKYSVWASTQNGNKKLDAVYHDAYKLSREARKVCPIFLFFLANGSGQFVGLAEMTGPVDFDKNMDFWQLERWNGFFPVEWRIIKDIPNHHFQHILNEFNENKPVTYCRDTQEIGLKKGLQMLDIFKSYQVTTMLLDDYDFYEKQGKLLPSRSSKGQDPPVFHGYASSPSTKATSYSARTVAPSLQAKAIPNSRGLPTGRTNVASLLTKTTSFPQSRPAACIDAPSLQAKAVPNSRGLPTARTNVASLLTKTTSYPQSRPAACIDAPSLRAKAVPNSRGLPTAHTVTSTRRTYTKFLVKWKYIQQDTWLNEDTFQQLDPEFYKRYMAYIDEEHVPEPAVTMSESVPATDSPKTNIAVPESVGNNVCDSSRTPESDPVTESSQMNIAVPESMGKNVSNSSTTLESDLVTESSKSAVT
ncbi:hypothetical protein C5167_048887 [Papaver somniferum]|uniref:YTH domain-containing family protein n=1 Tax=Papaver somniferum TaxID=3469 RepID=A0A4Y7KJ79_PAPSO|nr:hypothetical protein C5167_048887 [Papaver somniferum]